MFLDVKFTVTLMRLIPELEFHVESGDRVLTYYFRVPDAWAGDDSTKLQTRMFRVAREMYADLNRQFRIAEPDDPNYLLVKSTDAAPLTPDEVQAKPWESAPNPAVWEPTSCVVVNEDGSYVKVNPANFA